jgi:hypothetical protein
MKTPTNEPFIIEIQDNALEAKDASQFKRLLANYINKTGIAPKIEGLAAADYTLSNCVDNDNECTCCQDD